jgi:hypothetical protein
MGHGEAITGIGHVTRPEQAEQERKQKALHDVAQYIFYDSLYTPSEG